MSTRRLIKARPGLTYESIRRDFRWDVPDRMNMGTACCDSHPRRDLALITIARDGLRTEYTFGDIADLSNRLANGLASLGVGRGDRVGVVVPQSVEAAVAHMAIYKLGAVAMPLASLFGPDALAYRLADSGATTVITTPANTEKVVEASTGIDMRFVVTGDGATGQVQFDDLISRAHPRLESIPVDPESPAFLIYTSGTTGPPKGALHAHRSLIGHLPAFELYYEFSPAPEDVHWTPADWAWIGGLMDSLIPAWYYGLPVLTADHDFDPEWAASLLTSENVTCAFLPPTALKMMRAAGASPRDSTLRAVFTGGEALGEEMLEWAGSALGAAINEGYGQTEANLTVGNCSSVWPVRPGSMGRAMPGHDVRVLDADGRPVTGETGEIAVRGPDPVFMIEYWNRPDATADKYSGDWLLSGDLGREDEDGYLWFISRKDDVINSRGYRIGPGEVEESLMGHPCVAMAAVVGAPDQTRGEVPIAFVVLNDGFEPGEELVDELKEHVRVRLAAHEVPQRVQFVDDLPRTTTGKTMRRALRDAVRDGDGSSFWSVSLDLP